MEKALKTPKAVREPKVKKPKKEKKEKKEKKGKKGRPPKKSKELSDEPTEVKVNIHLVKVNNDLVARYLVVVHCKIYPTATV